MNKQHFSQTLYQVLLSIQNQLKNSEQSSVNEQAIINLVKVLRPLNSRNTEEINDQLRELITVLQHAPDLCFSLKEYLIRLMAQYRQTKLYADTGILSLDGFWNQLSQRIVAHFLPPLNEDTQLKNLLNHIFNHSSDKFWLEKVNPIIWDDLYQLLTFDNAQILELHHDIHAYTLVSKRAIIKAISVLSYRISGIGLFPELIYAEPKLTEYESPFIAQNREIVHFIQQFHHYLDQTHEVGVIILPDAAQVHVMIAQCQDIVSSIRRATKRIGVSLTLTYLLTVLEQSLERLELLIQLITPKGQNQAQTIKALLSDLIRAIHHEKSVRGLLSTNSELLALQVTENASKTGEHYVSSDKKGFFAMYRAAAGAGCIIATMATIKIILTRLTLSPFMHALSYSLNYALGFVFIHVLHFTVATKQPAMTAAALASTVQHRKGSRTTQLAELAELIVNIIRTQFIAILGNISIAMPTAALITLLWKFGWNEPLLSNTQATTLLHSLDPFTSLALPHAAIAGVFLFFSGLIAGYFDNMAIYRKIGLRLKAHQRLRQLLGEQRQHKFAEYVERNLGALAGNFLFGFMLGSMGTIGFILGLPLDIRHIAFASANLIQGLICIDGTPDLGLIIISSLGVLLIGLTNLFVSFSLTIIVALRARRVRFEQWKPLAKLVLTHFATRPSDFFWPPINAHKNETE
ncbi:MAG: site-specific recombinase [Acinetobacter sp.]